MKDRLPTIYDPDKAREWVLWKSDSLGHDDLRMFVKILAHALLNHEIYALFYERIEADRKKNLSNG